MEVLFNLIYYFIVYYSILFYSIYLKSKELFVIIF